MSQEIARTQEHLNEMINWSKAMSQGNLMPRQYQGNPANLMFAAEYADALGISRIHVLTSIAVINGRPTPSADLMAAMVRQHGHKLRIVSEDSYAEATLIRSDDPDFEYKARWDEAKARIAGLWGNKGPWTLYPAAMLRSRAISEVVRMGASDVMAGGIYTPEELGAVVDESGYTVETKAHATAERTDRPAQAQQAAQAPAPTQSSARDRLVNQLGAAPVDTQPADVWAEKIAGADSVDALMDLYQVASTNPEWETSIKPMFSARKEKLQATADAHNAGEQEPLDAEIVEPDTAA